MEACKIRYCKICLTTIDDESDFLFLKLGFDDVSKHEICNVCSAKLSSAQKFKLTCSCTENAISSFANDGKVFPLDLKEIYKKERGSEHLSDDVKICRLCLQPINHISEFKPINEDQIDMVHKLVPEMDIFIVKEPVICKSCLYSLDEHCDFLNKCSEIKQNTGCTDNEEVTCALSHPPSVGIPVKIEDVGNFEEDLLQLIKAECDDMNYEENGDGSEIHGQEIPAESPGCKYHRIQCHECNFCNYKTKDMFSLDKDAVISGDEKLHIYKCEINENESKYEDGIEKHKTTYEDPWKVQLGSHILVHESPSESDVDASVKNRVVNHKYSTARVSRKKCEICLHKFKYRGDLKRHMLVHKDPSEVQMYKCEACNFETKYKGVLKSHILTHKDPTDVQMYKCKYCCYETKYKGAVKLHMLKHKGPTEVRMYKCKNCTFETKYKHSLKGHMLVHKDPAEVKMYKCIICDYKTKYKTALRKHSLIHKNPLELQIYKCANCNYETKHKHALTTHMLLHKDPIEVQMYKCLFCDYRTKHNFSLRRHAIVVHKNPLEVQMYQFQDCKL